MTDKTVEKTTPAAPVADATTEDAVVADYLKSRDKGTASDSSGGSKRTLLQVEYEDGTVSDWVHIGRPKALVVFEREFGHSEPSGMSEVMWLVWHCLGRPGANGKPAAAGSTSDENYSDWFLSTYDTSTKEVDRGKARN